MLDFRNVNTLWSSILVETFARLGLTTAIICPGSRSTPLTIAFARHHDIETIPILDERSAAFFALGKAKKIGLPVALICTSGTAGANFYPAVIEATESRVPLIILTADRPPELRNCHAGQTIDQVKLYGNYPNWYTELALPEASLSMLKYLRQNTIQAWSRARFPFKGVVHLNLPFREPLAPIIQSEVIAKEKEFPLKEFFSHLSVTSDYQPQSYSNVISQWQSCTKGIIIAGLAQPEKPQLYSQAVAQLSHQLKFPVLAEALSPLRNYREINSYLISTYDLILRNPKLANQLVPEIIIQIGELPTSKQLRQWLENNSHSRYIIDPRPESFDPLHGKTIHLRTNIQQIVNCELLDYKPSKHFSYLQQWCDLDIQAQEKINQRMASLSELSEAKISWLLSKTLPNATSIYLANSMSVRNAEFFWLPNNKAITPYFNRGANGIDGTLSSALGLAYGEKNTVLLTGDLALLHDTNGFLINNKFQGHLTIILVNNNGGGIFEMLPISEFEPPFEEYFATPQKIDFAKLSQTYNIEYELITSWEQLQKTLNPLPKQGIRLIEVPTNRKLDGKWLKQDLFQLAQDLILN
ncbi:MAG: 2-succinyl-5-enolpyruvyl-6-hydroxy-3-cyclohexene-1-carboxylic-acid synthase [Xenococcaceae cyanobacterium MO_188.B19]|nr:2-succinyl-5-enolpyruvyl-6-hydroxy-3-cyclohexene-1-carboxylic-acid synthase [Xenococcaceae cyanobacterium MO_188.B19]